MPKTHEHSAAFLNLLRTSQHSFAQRRLADYFSVFSLEYTGVDMHTDFCEDLAQMKKRIVTDQERYELLTLDYRIVNHWYTGDMAYAYLQHYTRMRLRDVGRMMVDWRDSIVGARMGKDGLWRINLRLTVRAENFIEGVGNGS